MSGRDQLEKLDQKIADSLQSTADELRQDLDERFERVRKTVRGLLRETDAPDLSDLLSATTELASASSEQEVLESLVGQATRFSDRAIFFVVDVGGARSWAAAGFPEDISGGLSFDDPETGAWLHVTQEQGAVELSAEECAAILGDFNVEPASRGALVPLALGAHIAGALYADVSSGPAPTLVALQLLTQSAGQIIESLSLGPGGTGSPSLHIAIEGATVGNGSRLPLWNPERAPNPET
jgi:hypothetical protein